MKKKFLIISMIFVMILSCVVLTGCNNGEDKEENKEQTENVNNNNVVTNQIDNNNISNNTSKVKVSFTDNLCVALGYVESKNEKEFISKYFDSEDSYNNLPKYDHRDLSLQVEGYGNKFVVIPKDESVKLSIYECSVSEEGEIIVGKLIKDEIKGPFCILDDYIEYIPKMCIRLECNGFEEDIPIQFEGNEGKLNLLGYETEVLDISIY